MSNNFINFEDVEDNAEIYREKEIPNHLKDSSQRFCVMTVVAPEGTNQKSKEMAIRVYGCRSNMKEANKWAKAIRDNNPFWDVYVVSCNEWAALPPRIDSIEEVRCTEERVQTIHDQYVFEEVEKKKELELRLDQAHRKKENKTDVVIEEESSK
jgi:hypothetical protein